MTVMRGNAPAGVATADQSAPAPAGVATADEPGRARVMKVLMIATEYFKRNPGETHDDVRQQVRNVRPRFEARPRAETPPRAKTPPPAEAAAAAFAGLFERSGSSGSIFGGSPTTGGLFGSSPTTGGGIFGGTPPQDKKK